MLNLRQIALVALLFSVIAKGQIMQWSNPTKIKGPAVFSKVIAENQRGIYILKYRNRFYSKNVILERYNHLLAYEDGKSIDLNKARLIKLFVNTENILLIKSAYNRFTQTNQLIAQRYNLDFKTLDKPQLLAESYASDFSDKGSFRMRVSDAENYYSIIYTERGEKGSVVLHHYLLDKELKQRSSKTVALPYSPQDFRINDYLVSNTGTVSFLTQLSIREKRKVLNVQHSLFKLEGDSLSDFIISDTMELKSSRLVYDRFKDDARVVGLYGYSNALGIDGVLFYQLTKETNESLLQLNPFTEEFIAAVNQQDSKDFVSDGFSLLKAIPRSDGGILLIAEQKEINTEDDIIMVNGIPQSTSKNIYNYNEILVLNYDNEGFLDWHNVITKNQTTVNDGGYYSSAVVYVGDKYVQLFYNDQLRSSGDIMQHTVYNNGKSESKKLLKLELDYVAIIPRESKQVSSNKIIIPTLKNRRFALLKLIYN